MACPAQGLLTVTFATKGFCVPVTDAMGNLPTFDPVPHPTVKLHAVRVASKTCIFALNTFLISLHSSGIRMHATCNCIPSNAIVVVALLFLGRRDTRRGVVHIQVPPLDHQQFR